MPINYSIPFSGVAGYKPYDPYAAQRAAAAGMGAGANASSAYAGSTGTANQASAAPTYAAAANMGGSVQYAPDGHVLTQAEISDRARAQGAGAGAASSLGAVTQIGNANQANAAASYGNATNAAARPYSSLPPPPPVQGPAAGSFNAPYNTWQNAQQYGNPYAFNLPGSMGPATWSGSAGYANPAAANTPGAMGPATFDRSGGYMNPAAQNIPNGQGITGQNGTLDNIQPYMNPYLDQIISQGTNAISHSGAAQGLFGSSGNINDIGNFATNAASQAYGDAFNRFQQDRSYQAGQGWNQYNAGVQAGDTAYNRYTNDQNNMQADNWNRYGAGVTAGDTAYNRYAADQNNTQANNWHTYDAGAAAGADALNRASADRSYMTNQYNNQQARDDANYWNTNAANTDMYKYGNADYQGRLGDYYSANNGVTNTEQGAANATGAIYSNLADALSKLYGDSGNASAAGAVAGSNAQGGLLSGLMQLLGMGLFA